MRNYIILNGKNSNEINGLLIQELPPISKPLIRTEVEEIDGRDGDIVTPLGYSAYDKELTIGLYKDFDVNEVAAYFNSEGTVIFSNEPDKYYYYQITAQIDFERLVRYRTATVTMHCQPFKYSATEQPITEDVSGTVSDEGTNLALENTAEAPFNALDLKGNTEQDGTPTPDAPVAVQTVTGENVVKICGKNLYDFRDVTYKAGTFTADDDGWLTCTLNTAPSGNSDQAYYTHNLPLKNSTQYAVVLEVKSISGSGRLVVHSRWSGNQEGQFTTEQYADFSNLQAGKTYVYKPTTYASFNYDVGLRTYVRFAAGQTGSITFRLSVLADTDITADTFSYEPYQEQNYTIGLFGSKNIFDKDNANIWNGYMGDASLTAAANARSLYIPVAAGQTYTFTRPNTTSQVNDFGYCFITDVPVNGKAYLDGRHIISSALTFTATAPAGAKYMLVYFAWNPSAEQLATILSGYQIEYGSTPSAYEAFQRLELCNIPGTDYRDRFIPRDGKWYVHKVVDKIVLDGTESNYMTRTNTSTTHSKFRIASSVLSGNIAGTTAIVCDYFIANSGANTQDYSQNAICGSTAAGFQTQLWFSIANTIADTVDAFKAWVASNTPTVYYALATPTDTEITNEALIQQLDDIYYHAHAYKGRTHISSSAATGNVPHIIAAEVGEDNESTITNAGNYLSKPKITVYGSGDISLYINDMHALQITLGDEGYITIDTAQMEAYKDTLDNLKNRLVIGDYSNAHLKPGANKIHFTGTVTKYVVENYSRWL